MDNKLKLAFENIPLTREWLTRHGWRHIKNIPLFQNNPEYIDADLCVIINRKEYMVAKFHYMGAKAFEQDAEPDSFEVVGINNRVELLDYDYTRLVLAAFVCHLTELELINTAIAK